MSNRRRMTKAEAAVLDLQLPIGLTDEMRDVAFCLYEALVTADSRCGDTKPTGTWLDVLQKMARVASMQLQHLAQEKGGRNVYLSKSTVFHLSERDREMCAKFRGDYVALADEYNLTVMRVRQIVDAWMRERFLARQQSLPGLDPIN